LPKLEIWSALLAHSLKPHTSFVIGLANDKSRKGGLATQNYALTMFASLGLPFYTPITNSPEGCRGG